MVKEIKRKSNTDAVACSTSSPAVTRLTVYRWLHIIQVKDPRPSRPSGNNLWHGPPLTSSCSRSLNHMSLRVCMPTSICMNLISCSAACLYAFGGGCAFCSFFFGFAFLPLAFARLPEATEPKERVDDEVRFDRFDPRERFDRTDPREVDLDFERAL